VRGDHVYGWFTGARAYEHPANFFMLEHYYATHDTVFYLSADNDVYGPWVVASTRGASTVVPVAPAEAASPLPADLGHELERMQDVFVREWLFYRDDAEHAAEAEALRSRELPVLGVNVRPKKLNKLHTGQPVWTYFSPGADQNIVTFMARRWTLDYTPY
jgi:hypothetical protein